MKIAILLVALAAVIFVISRIRLWWREGRKLRQSGYLPPKPTWLAGAVMSIAARVLVFFGVGSVKVIGRKNIRSCKGKRVVIAPNHTFELDFAMTRKGTGLLFRYLAHCDEFKGIRGFLGAWTGGFGVNLKTENGGENARIACVKALKQNESSKLLIFPQGKLIRDNILRAEEFKTGAVRIARQVAEETGEPVVILPVALYYKQNPCESSRLNRLFHKLGLRFTRSMFSYTNYGGCVVIGKPIATQSLPEDPHAATEVLRKEIDALLTVAKSN